MPDSPGGSAAARHHRAGPVVGSSPGETSTDPSGGAPSPFLKIALVGPAAPPQGAHRSLATHTVALAHELTEAGHDVTLVTWTPPPASGRQPTGQALAVDPFPRTVRSLSRSRPDSWARTGLRLRGYDTVVVVHGGPALVPLQLALLRGAGASRRRDGGAPRAVLVVEELLPAHPVAGVRSLLASVLTRVDAVLLHNADQALEARRLGADRVLAVARPDASSRDRPLERRASSEGGAEGSANPSRATLPVGAAPATRARGGVSTAGDRLPELRGPARGPALAGLPADEQPSVDPAVDGVWAAYIGAIETLSAPSVAAADLHDEVGGRSGGTSVGRDRADRLARRSRLGRVQSLQHAVGDVRSHLVLARSGLARSGLARTGLTIAVARRAGRRVSLRRADLADWILPTDVLDDAAQSDDAAAEARRLGLRRHRDRISAWAALGALAAVVRVADNGGHTAIVVDESGARSPLSDWLRSVGFAPVDLGVTLEAGSLRDPDLLELDAGAVDVVARVHPGGCDASDLDETLAQASWVLRPGGVLIVTVPLGVPGTDLALAPADVRGVVARAHGHGFVLVGDLDGEIGRRMRRAATDAGGTDVRSPGAAYGLVRLTLRRL